jgi:hypothetical protein
MHPEVSWEHIEIEEGFVKFSQKKWGSMHTDSGHKLQLVHEALPVP